MANIWPGAFTVQGRMSSAGESLSVNNLASDPHIRLSDDRSVYEVYFVSGSTPGIGTPNPIPAQTAYTECPVGGNLLTGWSDPLEGGAAPVAKIAAVAGTDNEDGVDTPHAEIQPSYGKDGALFVYTEARPGARDIWAPILGVEPGGPGRAQIIKVATDVQRRPSARRQLCSRPSRTILTPTESWQRPFVFGGRMYGGVLEPSPIWDPGYGMWIFHIGLTESSTGSGIERSRLGRALSVDGLTPAVMNPSTPVWTAPTNWVRQSGIIPDVTRNALDSTLFDLVVRGEGANLYHYQSSDKGLTWVANPSNPIVRQVQSGFPSASGENEIGGSTWTLSEDGTEWLCVVDWRQNGDIGGANGGLYLVTAPVV